MNFSFIALAFGYAMMLSLGWVDFLPVNIITACAFGLFIFGGQAIFYMVVIVNMTNTIEYNEYKTGDRNEAIVFSLRPFVAKMSSAIQGLIVTLVLVASGVYVMSQNVSALEQEVSLFNEMTVTEKATYVSSIENGISAISIDEFDILSEVDKAEYIVELKDTVSTFENSTLGDRELVVLYEALQEPSNAVFNVSDDTAIGWTMTINEAADSVFLENATISMRLFLRLSITVIPALLILGSLYILRKKYIIDEVYYEEITAITKSRIEQKIAS